jgi:hypothetical protein
MEGRILSTSGDTHLCTLERDVEVGDKLLIRLRLSPPKMYVAEVCAASGRSIYVKPLTTPHAYDLRREHRHQVVGMSASILCGGKILNGCIHNFSARGTSIEVAQRVPHGSNVQLVLPEVGVTVSASARHARPTVSGTYLMGFRFHLDEIASSRLLKQALLATAKLRGLAG